MESRRCPMWHEAGKQRNRGGLDRCEIEMVVVTAQVRSLEGEGVMNNRVRIFGESTAGGEHSWKSSKMRRLTSACAVRSSDQKPFLRVFLLVEPMKRERGGEWENVEAKDAPAPGGHVAGRGEARGREGKRAGGRGG